MEQNMDTMGAMSEYATETLYDGVILSEVAKDYTLPDYQPEVRRVLHVGVQILPPAKYVTGNRAELNGNVEYTVLYVGMDGELYSAPLSAEYSAQIPFENAVGFDFGEGVHLLTDLTSETVNTRLTAPRRLSIKNRLRAKVCAYGKRRLEENGAHAAPAASIQRLGRAGESLEVADGLSEVITLEHSLPLPSENTRVVTADARVIPEESQCTHDRVTTVGHVECRLLCAMEEESGVRYETLSFELPFEGEVEYDLPEGGERKCRVGGRVGELSVNAAEGDIQCRIGVILDARVFSPSDMVYTEDLYSTECVTRCEYETHTLPVLRNCFASGLSQSERPALAGLNIPEGAEPVTAFGRATLDDVAWEGGKSVFTGRSQYTVVYRKDGEFAAGELMLPFRFEWDCPAEAKSFLGTAEVQSPKVKIEGETLMLDAELSLACALMGEGEARRVRNVEFGEPLPSRDHAVIVCYPSDNDTAWTVAKRYAVAPADVLGNPETDHYVMIR